MWDRGSEMSWTKRQFVEQAFEEIGLASYVFDLQAEQLQAALRRLDSMMARWNALGVRIGYPLPSSPEDSDLDTETSVPDAANEAVYTNLAIGIAPTVGKQISPETRSAAGRSYKALLVSNVEIVEQQVSNLPRGAGAKPYRHTRDEFLDNPTDELAAGNDSLIDLE